MKKTVKVLAILLAVTMLFALAACGNNPEGYYTIETITRKTGEEESITDFSTMSEEERASFDIFYCDLKFTKDRMIECDLDGSEIENQDSHEYKVEGNKIIFINLPELTAQSADITFDKNRITSIKIWNTYEGETIETTVYVKK